MMSVQQTIEQKIQLEFQPHFFSVEMKPLT